jgi:predicted GNAT superfamily acetyltransferase
VPNDIAEPAIVIRSIETVSDLRAVEALQKEVWGCADLDVAPLTILLASKEVGATLIGAYDGERLVGFVYGFPGYENNHATHHSHMLAVLPDYRSHQLGFKLKLAQRECVLAQGINRISWTFDPLQSLNAHLNFSKLGVIADRYRINFYGEATSSFLHQIGTDRLWVTWLLDSPRVRERLAHEKPCVAPDGTRVMTRVNAGGAPEKYEPADLRGHDHLAIEVPLDINGLQQAHPQLAVQWREATRQAFTRALELGYFVEDFYARRHDARPAGVYLLTRRELFGPEFAIRV